jgi:hypothetical protein
MVTFAADAFVNDQLLGYWGKTAIRDWAERDIIGERLKISTTKVVRHYDILIVTADIDGNFDEGGLPDPLVLAFYFASQRSHHPTDHHAQPARYLTAALKRSRRHRFETSPSEGRQTPVGRVQQRPRSGLKRKTSTRDKYFAF